MLMQWRKCAVRSVVAENFGMPNFEHDPTLYTKQNAAKGKNSAVDHVNHNQPALAGIAYLVPNLKSELTRQPALAYSERIVTPTKTK
jgi:hypothetical protein